MSTWRQTFNPIQDQVVRRLELVGRRVALDAFARVVNRTPVDTGRARGSWGVAVGQPRPGPHDRADTTGADVNREAQQAVATLNLGDRVFLVSNLAYIPVLESGSSQQAPSGMVAITRNELQPMAAAAVREARRAG